MSKKKDAPPRPVKRKPPGKRRAAPPAPPPRPVPPVVEGLESATLCAPCAALWDWPDRLLAGEINLLDGKKNGGKSIVAAAVAAHVTGGKALPGAPLARPRPVIWAAGEEPWESATLPRFIAAGGDTAWLYRLDLRGPDGKQRRLGLPSGLPDLIELLRQSRAGLLVLDPLGSICDPDWDLTKSQPARAWMEALAVALRAGGCTGLLTRNCRKGTGGDPLDSGLGNSEITNASRVVLRADRHPSEDKLRCLSVVASNLGSIPPALCFRVEKVGYAARIAWEGESTLDAEALAEGRGASSERQEAADAHRLLRALLTEGEKPSRSIRLEAEDAGISIKALRRARGELGITAVRKSTGNTGAGCWYWVPPKKGFPPELVDTDVSEDLERA